tara:strand:- start:165 stop:485 length:321 start_codon:yes stop_codon:yes gene_type:complete
MGNLIERIKQEQASPGLEKFIEEFYNDRITDLKIIQKRLKVMDLESIKEYGHKWKGFCEPYGFQYLGVLGEVLEEKILTGHNLKSLESIVEEIEEYLILKGKYLGL